MIFAPREIADAYPGDGEEQVCSRMYLLGYYHAKKGLDSAGAYRVLQGLTRQQEAYRLGHADGKGDGLKETQ